MYIELHACSAFSFLRGGSSPEELAKTAAKLQMPSMALLVGGARVTPGRYLAALDALRGEAYVGLYDVGPDGAIAEVEPARHPQGGLRRPAVAGFDWELSWASPCSTARCRRPIAATVLSRVAPPMTPSLLQPLLTLHLVGWRASSCRRS